MNRVSKSLFVMSLLLATSAGAQQMYRWVDDKGKVHYGDTIPPEYANRGNQQMNKSGRVVKKTDAAMTPEQIKARDDAEAKAKQDKLNAEEQKRRDKALLSTYTDVKEIDLNEKRNLDQMNVRIQSNELNMKSVQARLDEIKKREAGFPARGKPVPPDVTAQVKATEQEMERVRNNVKEIEQEKTAIRARFATDRARFRELKGLPPEVAKPTPPTSPVVPAPVAPQAPARK